MATVKFLVTIFFLHIGILSSAKTNTDSIPANFNHQKWSASIEKKTENLGEKIIARSQKTLNKLQKQEEKLYAKMLEGKDSIQAKRAITSIRSKYQTLRDKIQNPALANGDRQYLPKLDTLTTALKFLDQQGIGGKVTDALGKTRSLQDKFQQAEEIKKFIQERKATMQEQMEKLGLLKELKRFNKEVYYYSAYIKEYKELLKDSKKAERKALELLSQTKMFKDFMRKNSMLASLFRLPGNADAPGVQASLNGLQTSAQVNGLIQQQLAAGGPNAQSQFRQNMQEAQRQLNEIKSKLNQFDAGSDGPAAGSFKPNNQKSKSFLRRLEYGTNIQTQKATNFFPVTSDIGLSLGYKINDNSVIGIGASYKVGMGRGWNNIHITSEGVGLRTFIDWKIKGSFWISGGYEQNYKTSFSDFAQLRDRTRWQESGLAGLSKIVSLKSKFFKKTKLQLLWDFLSYQQVPRTQPILVRVGYNF